MNVNPSKFINKKIFNFKCSGNKKREKIMLKEEICSQSQPQYLDCILYNLIAPIFYSTNTTHRLQE